MVNLNISNHPLRNSLSDTLIFDISDVYGELDNSPFQLSKFNKQEIIRQAFYVFDKMFDSFIDYAKTAKIDFIYLVDNFNQEQQNILNEIFRKILLFLYFKCYELKLFVGRDFPNIPRFPYFLENASEAGCILKLDTTYF